MGCAQSAEPRLFTNALRYSPDGSPPLLTARARGNRVELRVADTPHRPHANPRPRPRPSMALCWS